MEKYLRKLCKAILADRFNDEKYRQKNSWHGVEIETSPLFCSYGLIGFTVSVYNSRGNHYCDVEWDADLGKLSIDETPWKEYINTLYLEDNNIFNPSEGEFETYTDAGEDMIISLEEVTKDCLQQYINDFDINENVIMWWQYGEETAKTRNVPFDNIKEHYEDYEAYLKNLQKVCNKMPF